MKQKPFPKATCSSSCDLPQVTKHALETQREFELRAKEEELKERMMAAKREVSLG